MASLSVPVGWQYVGMRIKPTSHFQDLLHPFAKHNGGPLGALKKYRIFRAPPQVLRHTHSLCRVPIAGCPSLKLGYFVRSQSVLPARFSQMLAVPVSSQQHSCKRAAGDWCALGLLTIAFPLAYLALVETVCAHASSTGRIDCLPIIPSQST